VQSFVDTAGDGRIEDAAGSLAWAANQLDQVLRTAGLQPAATTPGKGANAGVRVVVTSPTSRIGQQVLHETGLSRPDGTESFALSIAAGADRPIVVVAPAARGAGYGLLELADIAAHADDPLARLRQLAPESHAPATRVRSILRPFTSVTEDMAWWTDHGFWDAYLTELATQRINRIQIAFGLQYNYGHNPVTDTYLCFPYPFLLDVPGYDVRAENVNQAERDRNLAILRYASDEAKRRGIDFQLGLWNHAYDQTVGDFTYDNGINDPQFPIVGLTPDTHADYCGAALELLLRSCPSIDGLTLRVHYEGGVPDDQRTAFWRTTLAGVGRLGRPVEIDMHAKGVDEAMIDTGRATGQRVVLSTKYWAEHLGLPYHQASIREKERVPADRPGGLRAITGFERSFTRYGYGDFLTEDRDFDVLFRIWHGGQRVLLWGDPRLVAGIGRFGTFCDAVGVEMFDPLSFKGRKGTGTPGQRDPYADPTLQLAGQEWRKYRYTYRLWGRLLYDPDSSPDGWRRFLAAGFGRAAAAVEQAVGAASRVVPLVTVAHGVGASISGYWPEMYIDMPIVDGPHVDHYAGDSGVTRFSAVSSFDPVLFATVDEYADQLTDGSTDGRYSPLDVAGWLDVLAQEAEDALARATAEVADPKDPEFRRVSVDVTALAQLGRFFAGKFRAALHHSLYERTGDTEHLDAAVDAYRRARQAYATVADVTTGVYRADLTFGYRLAEHGHWADRVPAVEADLAAMERLREKVRAADEASPAEPAANRPAPARKNGPRTRVEHTPPASFTPGQDATITVSLESGSLESGSLESGSVGPGFSGRVVLHYRHLNHREAYETVTMTGTTTGTAGNLQAVIPAAYTDSAFPLVYFFTVFEPTGEAWLAPGLHPPFDGQPYHVIRAAGADRRAPS
jgi:hypothetical protein